MTARPLLLIAASCLWLFVPVVQAQEHAQEPRVDRIEVIEAGFFVYEAASTRTDSPQSVEGVLVTPKNMRFLTETPAVTAKVGVSFGVRFLTVGEPRNAPVRLHTVWKIPPPGMTNPQNGRTYHESASDVTTRIGTGYLSGYGFDNQWEAVLGVWLLQVWQGNRKLLEHSFTIR